MVSRGANIHARELFNLQTPLMYALIKDNTEIINTLLVAGADINATDDDGCTALMHASGRSEIEKLLIENGATPYQKEDMCTVNTSGMIMRLFGPDGVLSEEEKTPTAFESFLKTWKSSKNDQNYSRALYFYTNGEYEKSKKHLNKYIKDNPDDYKAYYDRGLINQKLGEVEMSIIDFTKSIELDPTYVWSYTQRCKSYGMNKEYKKSIEDCSKAIEINKNIEEPYNFRCRSYLKINDLTKALNDCNISIDISGNYLWPYYNRAKIYEKMNLYNEALFDYNKLVEMNDDNALYYLKRAEIYQKLGVYKKTFEDLYRATVIEPDNAFIYNKTAWLLATCPQSVYRDGERAIESALRATSLEPENIGYLDTLAAAYAEADHFENAVEIQKKVIKVLKQQSPSSRFLEEAEEHLRYYETNKPWREGEISQNIKTEKTDSVEHPTRDMKIDENAESRARTLCEERVKGELGESGRYRLVEDRVWFLEETRVFMFSGEIFDNKAPDDKSPYYGTYYCRLPDNELVEASIGKSYFYYDK